MKKKNMGGWRWPLTSDDRRRGGYAIGIGVCKRLVTLSKSKILKYL